jgi:hypothetical protein
VDFIDSAGKHASASTNGIVASSDSQLEMKSWAYQGLLGHIVLSLEDGTNLSIPYQITGRN